MLKLRVALLVILTCAFQLFSCSGKDDNSVTPPTQRQVEMVGQVAFPEGMSTGFGDVTVGFGAFESDVDTAGAFAIKGNEHIPGLASVYDSDDNAPLLMSIVADPQADLAFSLDVHSTAIALAFLNPIVCSSDEAVAAATIAVLETLPELGDLEDLLSSKLVENPDALVTEDEEIDAALSAVVDAYLDSFPEEQLAPVVSALSEVISKTATSPPDIVPSTSVSGLTLSWKGGNTFELQNSFGRWGYCCTPDDTFFVFPNGDLLDALKLQRPWQPSKREFTMAIDPGDTGFVDVYSYGFIDIAANKWDSLSHSEQNNAHAGGITTVVMELFCNIVSVTTNTPRIYGNEMVAQRWGKLGWDPIIKNSRYMQRAAEYIDKDDPWGLSWYLTKQIISEFVNSATYRAFLMETLGLSLTDGAAQKLAGWLLVPAKVAINLNSTASALKTAMGLTSGRFATHFEVYTTIEDFGSVHGQVADKNSGIAIEGATVQLDGDDNNPLNPTHTVTTDASGNYTFTNISTGEKSITAGKSGYTSNTVDATIVKDAMVTQNITLERPSGGVRGQVLNDIYLNNGIDPANFHGTIDITSRLTSGQGTPGAHHAFDGSYTISLQTGNWWIIASADNYESDSVAVAISADGGNASPRDLILKPKNRFSGTVKLNMDNSGNYDEEFDLEFVEVGLGVPAQSPNPCPFGGSPVAVMEISALIGDYYGGFEAIGIGLNPARITGADVYALGGSEMYSCSYGNVAAMATYMTSRHYCSSPEGWDSPLSFSITGDPDMGGCNCGITTPGNLYLEHWGTEPGDSVVGSFVVSLAGWKTCGCSGDDANSDGHNDRWDVSCAQARLEMSFCVLVGSDYLVSFDKKKLLSVRAVR
ncbi:MAG: carboxypeptidase-like regulatory domain-containing protein [Candidatus Zixiibacteriota bacterium]